MVKRHMLRDILFNENRMESPLKRCHNDGKCIRYFHFPANNMQWVEVSSETGGSAIFLANYWTGGYHKVLWGSSRSL